MSDPILSGMFKGGVNFLIKNTTPGVLGLLPNVPYNSQAEASHGIATQVGLGIGTAPAIGVLAGGATHCRA